ncbi:uncharacterized protein GIQ15_04256 [Arthroderma uncinatum]|uniref:uncharacterized protein n=1 Tax=Arthroderma uncinatum TaxID=74035 RepID=UPI00144A90B8|nr:uncharacterized protein GIQ15_04256 [Arthroderma uncinatum]KAF3481497.1 hypothetical protein GIQ15_04256 [Arthroderma uncinatum]
MTAIMAQSVSSAGYEKYSFGDHSLQNVYVHIPSPQPPSKSGYWIVYIHGGAWRDPEILAPTFKPTQDVLLASNNADIAGIASIEYRLTAHPNFPQDAVSVNPQEYRNAKHPDHVSDVQKGLALLQEKYAFGERYILAGHSCGATLAFQAVMNRIVPASNIVRPLAIVGVAGIYDMPFLVKTLSHIPAYREFITDAFGAEEVWRKASPAPDTAGGVVESWKNGRVAVLARSTNDELMHASQLPTMEEALRPWVAGGEGGKPRRVKVIEDLSETHDGIWRGGKELASLISVAIKELRDLEA